MVRKRLIYSIGPHCERWWRRCWVEQNRACQSGDDIQSICCLFLNPPRALTKDRAVISRKKGKGFLLPNNCAVHLPLELWSLCRVAGILMWASRMRKMWGEYATLRAVLACLLQIYSISLVVVLFSRLQCFTDCHRALRACVRLFRRATMMMMTAAAQ